MKKTLVVIGLCAMFFSAKGQRDCNSAERKLIMTSNWIKTLDLPCEPVWDEAFSVYKCELSDTEELMMLRKGCAGDDEGYFIEYRIWEEIPLKEDYWIEKALFYSKLFELPFCTEALATSSYQLSFPEENRLWFEFSEDEQEAFILNDFSSIEITFFQVNKARYNSFLTIDLTLYKEC